MKNCQATLNNKRNLPPPFILGLITLLTFQLFCNTAFADPPESIDPLSPVPIPGTKNVLERPRYRIPGSNSAFVAFRKPADKPLFGTGLRRHASFQQLVGETGRILDVNPDPTYNCHYHALGQSIGLPRMWIDGMQSELTLGGNSVIAILSHYYEAFLYEYNPDNIASTICHNDDVVEGDIVILFKTGNPVEYAHSMIVQERAARCLFDSKVGEGYLVRTEIEPILREYDGLYNAAVVVRRRAGRAPSIPGVNPESGVIPLGDSKGGTIQSGGACNAVLFDNEQGYNLGSTLPWCRYAAGLKPGDATNVDPNNPNLGEEEDPPVPMPLTLSAYTPSGLQAGASVRIQPGDSFSVKMAKIKTELERLNPNWRAEIRQGCGSQESCLVFHYRHYDTLDQGLEPATKIWMSDPTSKAVTTSLLTDDLNPNSSAAQYSLAVMGAPVLERSTATLATSTASAAVDAEVGQISDQVIENLCRQFDGRFPYLVCGGSALTLQTGGNGGGSFVRYDGPREFVTIGVEVVYCGRDCAAG